MNDKVTSKTHRLSELCLDKSRRELAQKLWDKRTPLKNTPAEQYIVQTRKIPQEVAQNLKLYSLKGPVGIKEFDTNKPHNDYVIVPVYNMDNELIGVQLIQVTAQGTKAMTGNQCKRYIGETKPIREGKAAVLQQTNNVDAVFIAEGIETAASIAALDKVRNKYTVLASLGVTELSSTLIYVKTHYPPGAHVILLQDHDAAGSDADKNFIMAQQLFEAAGYNVSVRKPETLDEDWNDVLEKRGLDELTAEFNSDSLPLSVDPNNIRSQVAVQFANVYSSLVASEKVVEENTILLLLNEVIDQLIENLNEIAANQDMQKSAAELRIVEINTRLIHQMLEDNTPLPPIPKQYIKLQEELTKLEVLNNNKRNDLRKEPQAQAKRNISDAFHDALANLDNMKENTKMIQYHKRQLKSIDTNINNIKALIHECNFQNEKDLQQSLKTQLQSLLQAKNFHIKQLQLFDNNLTKSTQYDHFFIQKIQSLLENDVVSPHKIRAELINDYDLELKKLQQIHEKRINGFRVHFNEQKQQAINPLKQHLMDLKKIIQSKDQKLQKRILEPQYRSYEESYLKAIKELEHESVPLFQNWLNSLNELKLIKPLIYHAPKIGKSIGNVELIEEDSDDEKILDDLMKELFCDFMLDERQSRISGRPSDAQELVRSLRHLEVNDDPLLHLTIQDFIEQLTTNLYKSFEVSSLDGKVRQEFDGLAFINDRLTIIERKANDGTGPDVLQRNFCQQKIESKQKFIKRDIIKDLLACRSPQHHIHIEKPVQKEWYSEKFTPRMQNCLINAAKFEILKAFKDLTIEFTLNRPACYSPDAYKGVFFKRNLIQNVSFRFSEEQKGNEDKAHTRIDNLVKDRTEKRADSAETQSFIDTLFHNPT